MSMPSSSSPSTFVLLSHSCDWLGKDRWILVRYSPYGGPRAMTLQHSTAVSALVNQLFQAVWSLGMPPRHTSIGSSRPPPQCRPSICDLTIASFVKRPAFVFDESSSCFRLGKSTMSEGSASIHHSTCQTQESRCTSWF